MLPSWYPPHRLIVSSAATKYIIHYPLGFVNAFFKFLKIFPAGRISAAEKCSNIKVFCLRTLSVLHHAIPCPQHIFPLNIPSGKKQRRKSFSFTAPVNVISFFAFRVRSGARREPCSLCFAPVRFLSRLSLRNRRSCIRTFRS